MQRTQRTQQERSKNAGREVSVVFKVSRELDESVEFKVCILFIEVIVWILQMQQLRSISHVLHVFHILCITRITYVLQLQYGKCLND